MKHLYPLLLLLILFNSCEAQSTYSKEVEEQIKQVENNLSGPVKVEGIAPWNLYDRLAHYKFNGVSIAVIQNYKIVWAKGYGWADVQEKIPVTANTLFQVASVSKSINSMGVLKLAQDKKIDLNTDINHYLNSWKFPYDAVSNGKKITTLNLLTHTGGISNNAPQYVSKDTIPTLIQILNGEASPSRFIWSDVTAARSITEPNLFSQYSNNGIAITQVMVSDITHEPYEQYIAETVFKPLGMMHSCYTADSIKSQHQVLATAYMNGVEVPGKHIIVPPIAAGGLLTTPTDLAKFIIELQLSYQGKSNKVLSKEMTMRMLTPYLGNTAPGVFIRQPQPNSSTHFDLVKLIDPDAGKYFEHSGSMPGFYSQYYGSMEGGNGVVVVVNSGSADAFMNEIINSVATVYKWKDFYQPEYKKAVTVADSTLKKYVGAYKSADEFTMIEQRADGDYLFSNGDYSKMYFTNDSSFFVMENQTEKQFVKDASGNVKSYSFTVNGCAVPAAKILTISSLTGSEDFFGNAGWNLLTNKNYDEAIKYLSRGLELYPTLLMMELNLAHCYLFKNDYAAALKIYKAHLNENITEQFDWTETIKSDFVYFKNHQFDTSGMDKILTDLKLEIPDGY